MKLENAAIAAEQTHKYDEDDGDAWNRVWVPFIHHE
jgi:hypothetical protein